MAQEYSLREKKHARTKIAIMNAFVKRFEDAQYDNISIKEICKDAEVSEGTFFNYFSEKTDIISYYMQMLFIKIIWRAQKAITNGKYLPLINATFDKMSEELDNTKIVYQIISVLVIQKEKPKTLSIPEIEKKMYFPDFPGIEEIETMFVEDFLRDCLKKAQKNNEFHPDVKLDDILVSLMAIMVGTLVALKFEKIKSKGYHYTRQLQILWNSLGLKELARAK